MFQDASLLERRENVYPRQSERRPTKPTRSRANYPRNCPFHCLQSPYLGTPKLPKIPVLSESGEGKY